MRHDDGSWLVDGGTAVEDLEPVMDLDPRTAQDRRSSRTVAGLVLSTLGHLPLAGEHIEHSGARFTVERMQGRRIDQVRVRILPSKPYATDD